MTKSALQIARAAYQPKLPKALKGTVKAAEGAATQSVADQEEIKKLFPNTYGMPLIKFETTDEVVNFPAMNVGVILSGGQAPGGHNVISGIFDGIKKLNKDSKLYGFILGPGGLVDHNYMELTADIIDEYRNTGGFDIIGSGRTKLEKEEQFEKGYEILKELGIKALVIIGGDDSNTNACVLAEYYAAKNYGVQVIGCPKTIDGDLKNDMIETSFGFDTACKTYSEVIGNIQRDCNSARKYWHFIKLMGRSASHIALECALQVQPNMCIISEEVEAKDMSLDDIVTSIAKVVAERAAQGNNFGTVLIPEGLVEFIPAMKRLIAELNDFLAANAEDLGYRYFETFAPEKVLYPFGFGLSYTAFSIEMTDFHETADAVDMTVSVHNTGDCAGKEVVQLYCEAPQGMLGKPARTLCAFAKTKLLAAGEAQLLTLTVRKNDLASYDDSGVTGHPFCEVLEAGTYRFFLGGDVRSAGQIGTFTLAETHVTAQRTQALAPVSPFQRMKNCGGKLSWEDVPLREYNLHQRVQAHLPESMPMTGNRGFRLSDVADGKISMADFVAQMDENMLCALVRGEGMCSPKVTPGTAGAFGGLSPKLQALGIPAICCAVRTVPQGQHIH